MAKSKGIDPQFRPEWMNLPGYLASQDFLTHSVSITEAFDRLDIMRGSDAEAFLKAPAEAVAQRVKDGYMDAEMFIEVSLAFALIAVCAEREHTRHEAEDRHREIMEKVTQDEKEVGKSDGDSSIPL